ncbi:MAG: hypothetical protein ACI802_002799 [Candidatus Paceibacteria bacterium]|jgi:hypothetical protein
MSRPAFVLSDDQARRLIVQLAPVLEAHPVGARDHRAFVRAFIGAVHAATDQTLSPVLYRRLMAAYAPGRGPSTTTLQQEKVAFEEALAQEARAGRTLDAGHAGPDLGEVVRRSVEQALAARTPAPGRPHDMAADPIALAQRDFLQTRLADIEQALLETRAQAARLAAQLQAAQAVHTEQAERIAVMDAQQVSVQQQSAQLLAEVGEQRRYAMQSIDAVRGETRAWKERCTELTAQLARSMQLQEVFRQAAYARGAAIPSLLEQDPPP